MHKMTFLRRAEVMDMLGVTRYQLECLVDSKLLNPIILKGMKQKIFKTKEVMGVKLQNEKS
tara:strand:+ start:6796 stop:6978 length:183 start_codon:yes stop_codon:yes gene_type:complete